MIKKERKMGKNFYISDLHFGHHNIIRYDNRPFKTIEEMNETMIANWNKVVSNQDYVYILGDISWYDDDKTVQIFRRLNGTKILIKGNHDNIKRNSELAKCFASIQDYAELYLDKKNKVVMSHYPILFWNGQFRDTVHLYGHVHNSHQWNMCESWADEARQLQDIPMRMYNVGCMMEWMDYTPRTLDEIIEGYKQYKGKENKIC
jgi:calcineurin-like phosphoesterase family protein